MGLFLELAEVFGGDFDIFEVVRAIGAEDGLLVAFAEDEDEVAFFGEVDGLFDSVIAIDGNEEVFILDFAGFFGTFNELLGDFLRVFVTGVVFGDNDGVGVFAEDFATDETGGFVATSGSAMKSDDSALVSLNGGEDLFEGVRSVGVVDDDFKILTFA